MVRYGAAVLASLALGGCGAGADDPDNIPRRGQWQREIKLVTLVANDIWLERKDAPFTLPEDKSEMLGCVEPKLRTLDRLNAMLLPEDGDLACAFDTIDRKDGRFAAAGKCNQVERDGTEVFGSIELEGREKPDQVKGTTGMSLIVRGRQGSAERVRAAYESVWTRLGDC